MAASKKDYLVTLFRCVGLSRFHIRPARPRQLEKALLHPLPILPTTFVSWLCTACATAEKNSSTRLKAAIAQF